MNDENTVVVCRGCGSEATRMVEIDPPTPRRSQTSVEPACDDCAEDFPVVRVLDEDGGEVQD